MPGEVTASSDDPKHNTPADHFELDLEVVDSSTRAATTALEGMAGMPATRINKDACEQASLLIDRNPLDPQAASFCEGVLAASDCSTLASTTALDDKADLAGMTTNRIDDLQDSCELEGMLAAAQANLQRVRGLVELRELALGHKMLTGVVVAIQDALDSKSLQTSRKYEYFGISPEMGARIIGALCDLHADLPQIVWQLQRVVEDNISKSTTDCGMGDYNVGKPNFETHAIFCNTTVQNKTARRGWLSNDPKLPGSGREPTLFSTSDVNSHETPKNGSARGLDRGTYGNVCENSDTPLPNTLDVPGSTVTSALASIANRMSESVHGPVWLAEPTSKAIFDQSTQIWKDAYLHGSPVAETDTTLTSLGVRQALAHSQQIWYTALPTRYGAAAIDPAKWSIIVAAAPMDADAVKVSPFTTSERISVELLAVNNDRSSWPRRRQAVMCDLTRYFIYFASMVGGVKEIFVCSIGAKPSVPLKAPEHKDFRSVLIVKKY